MLGVGTLALGTGLVAGLVDKSKEYAVLEECRKTDPTAKRCPPDLEDDADTARTFATVSTIGFVGGAILVPAGVALLVWRPFGRSSAGVVVGPARVAVAGSF
jgi:hypothetical protein